MELAPLPPTPQTRVHILNRWFRQHLPSCGSPAVRVSSTQVQGLRKVLNDGQSRCPPTKVMRQSRKARLETDSMQKHIRANCLASCSKMVTGVSGDHFLPKHGASRSALRVKKSANGLTLLELGQRLPRLGLLSQVRTISSFSHSRTYGSLDNKDT
jgi:hypothetical protein